MIANVKSIQALVALVSSFREDVLQAIGEQINVAAICVVAVIAVTDGGGVAWSVVADSMPPRDAPGGGGAVASRVYILASTGDTRSFDFRIFSSIESRVSRMRLAVSVVAFGEGDARPFAAGVAPACTREAS